MIVIVDVVWIGTTLLLLQNIERVSSREAPHLLQAFDRYEGGQWLALALDNEFVVPKGNPIEHVPYALPNVDGRNLLCHLSSCKYSTCYTCN